MMAPGFRRSLFAAAALFLLGSALGFAGPAEPAGPGVQRPNIVLFFIDDLGWKDVSFMGSKFYETPHVDRLAREGMVFTSAYANGPNCAPSRACLLSGKYTPRHGVYTVGDPARGNHKFRKLVPIANRTDLDPKFVTFAEALKGAGYVTATMGKWHLGKDPTKQGFDVNVGGNTTGSPRGGYFSPYRNPQLPDGPKGEYLTDRLTDEAEEFIAANRGKPFLLYLTHYAVHTPIQAKKEITEKYRQKKPAGGHKNAAYAAMIESVDQSVGRVLKKLDELDLTGNTVVVFFSDNGGHGGVTSMAPLRGSKGMLYEGGIREPLVVKWPGKVKPGSRCDVPVIGVDLYPTFLEIAGATKGDGNALDGESLLPLLEQKGGLERQAIFWHFPCYLQAYRSVTGPFRTTPAGAVRRGDWKLLEFFEDNRLELYNLHEDIGERNNLAGKMTERARKLHQLLRDWRKSVSAPVPTERNSRYDPNAKWKPGKGAARKKEKKKKRTGRRTLVRTM